MALQEIDAPARKPELKSTTPTRLQDSSSESAESVASASASSSDSDSSVGASGASNCDSILDDLEVWYDRLQPMGNELHRECAGGTDRFKSWFEQTWDFAFTQDSLHKLMLLPDA